MKSFHRGHNQHVRPDEQISRDSEDLTPRQKRELKRETNRKRRTRERKLEEER